MIPREFRGAWSACVYNIDWPSNKGLSAATQTAELRAMLDKMAKLRMNALIFQIRPNADAVYNSGIEPASHWISGTMVVLRDMILWRIAFNRRMHGGSKCTRGSTRFGHFQTKKFWHLQSM